MDIKDLKPNSNKYKNSLIQNDHNDILPQRTRMRKVSMLRRVMAFIFAEDIENMGDDILFDFVRPRARDFIFDLITSFAERAIYGSSARGRGSNKRVSNDGRTWVSYDAYSKSGKRDDRRNEYVRHGYIPDRDLEFDTEGEAKDCLDDMVEILSLYDVVKVSEYYDLRKRTTPNRYVDRSFGWKDLRGTRVIRLKGGSWILDLPRYIDLDAEDRR